MLNNFKSKRNAILVNSRLRGKCHFPLANHSTVLKHFQIVLAITVLVIKQELI